MNQCYGCTTCESADKPLEGFIRELPFETSHHRKDRVQNVRLAFREFAAAYVQTAHAVSHPRRREAYAGRRQIQSWREIS